MKIASLTFPAVLLAALPIAWQGGLAESPVGPIQEQREEPEAVEPKPVLEAFEVAELLRKRAERGRSYLEFLDRGTLSCGLYVLPAGSEDRQSPHARDEVYYVLSGRAAFRVGEEDVAAEPGAVLFVAAGAEHRFHRIEETLELLVFFSKADPAAREHGPGEPDGGGDRER